MEYKQGIPSENGYYWMNETSTLLKLPSELVQIYEKEYKVLEETRNGRFIYIVSEKSEYLLDYKTDSSLAWFCGPLIPPRF
jgi:hypothetical protein